MSKEQEQKTGKQAQKNGQAATNGQSSETESQKDDRIDVNERRATHYHVGLDNSSRDNPYGWYRSKATGESYRIGAFDLRIHSKINRYSQQSQQWEVDKYEIQMFWPNKNYTRLNKSDNFAMEAKELLSKKAFQEAAFVHADKEAVVYSDDEQLKFITHITAQNKPRDVYEFDKYGFITHRGYHFYLAKNILVTLDANGTPLFVDPEPDTGMFRYPVPEDSQPFYVKPGRIEPAPKFDLSGYQPEDGFYSVEEIVFDKDNLHVAVNNYRERFGCMTAGQMPEHKPEGHLLFAYLLSFFFFDDIYAVQQHVIYIYLYGKPSIGKGKLSQFGLNFFGQDFIDVDSNPTLKSAENKLGNHSRIPVIMDEFVPGEGKITAQIYNMWYELRQRGVSAGWDRSKNQYNVPESQLWFISNYKPVEDHFRSRCLMFEYTKEKRGDISHVWWFENNKQDLQRLFLSILVHWYNDWDRALFREELVAVKRDLAAAVDTELERRAEREGMSFNIKDRQLDSMAALIVVDLFVCNRYHEKYLREHQKHAHRLNDPLGSLSEKEKENLQFQVEHYTEMIEGNRRGELYRYGVRHLARSAEKEISKSPLQQFLATLEVLADKDELPVKHYQFCDRAKPGGKDGDLKFAWTHLWDAYEQHRIGREKVNEETVKAEIEAIDRNGKATTHRIRQFAQHGFRIPHFSLTASWYRAFGENTKANEVVKLNETTDENENQQQEFTGDVPF